MIPTTMDGARRGPTGLAPGPRTQRRHIIRLWIPLFLLWLLLAPIALLLSPLLIVIWAAGRRDVFQITGTLIGLFAGVSGTRIEVESPDAVIFIRIL